MGAGWLGGGEPGPNRVGGVGFAGDAWAAPGSRAGELAVAEPAARARVVVVRGDVIVESAEALVGLPPRSRSVLDVLSSLRDNSLLRVTQTPELAGEVRFTLLDTIRNYAAQKLEQTNGVERALERHAAYYLTRGEVWSALDPSTAAASTTLPVRLRKRWPYA